MTIIFYCLLGLIQGLCEFLPISSSGHIVLFAKIFGVEEILLVSIILHTATLFSLLLVFRKEVFFLIRHPLSKETFFLLLSSIATGIVALILFPLADKAFSGKGLSITFAISAILLFITEIKIKDRKTEKFSLKHALLMGITQGFAIFPGLTRSGTTICAGELAGASEKDCLRFSFLLSIPIIVLSLLGEIVNCTQVGVGNISVLGLILASFISFVSGLISIKFMMKKFTKKWIFSLYLAFMALVSLIIL